MTTGISIESRWEDETVCIDAFFPLISLSEMAVVHLLIFPCYIRSENNLKILLNSQIPSNLEPFYLVNYRRKK